MYKSMRACPKCCMTMLTLELMVRHLWLQLREKMMVCTETPPGAYGSPRKPVTFICVSVLFQVQAFGGHSGYRSTLTALRNFCTWNTIDRDVKIVFNICLLCQSAISGDKTPRLFGQALQATKPNEALHMDYLYMGPSESGHKYLLLVKNDLSSYFWLVPAITADSGTTIEALTSWFAACGVATTWVSDQGSLFKNKVMTGVCKALRTQHHFTTAYCPWANGTVERACREVFLVVQALLSEFQLRPTKWPDVVKSLQSALNNSPSPQRGNIAPLTAFTAGTQTHRCCM